MYQKERIDAVYDIIKKNGYVTVKYLINEIHYSSATINRDLNMLEKQGLIRRSYGGAELIEKKVAPLTFRYHKMKATKEKMGKAAAELVNDGDIIFIDGSTTTECIGKYITDKKDITVITNNIALVLYLSEFGINTICLGGNVVEIPCILGGSITIENSMRYSVDKAFFSTSALSLDGKIASVTPELGSYSILLKVILGNSKVNCCIMDHEKVGIAYRAVYCTLDDINCLVSDYVFDKKFHEHFKNTKIITVH